jgi:hypothetical protein
VKCFIPIKLIQICCKFYGLYYKPECNATNISAIPEAICNSKQAKKCLLSFTVEGKTTEEVKRPEHVCSVHSNKGWCLISSLLAAKFVV